MLARGAIHFPGLFNFIKQCELKEQKEQILKEIPEVPINTYEELEVEEENKDCELLSKKRKKGKEEDNKNVDHQSKNLSKLMESKHAGHQIDVVSFIKELLELSIKFENHFHNTKYNMLYILKTHKSHSKLFNEIQSTKDYEQLKVILNSKSE